MPYNYCSIAVQITSAIEVKSASNAVQVKSQCLQNGCRMQRSRIQTKCSWNTYNVLQMKLKFNMNVQSVSRIWPNYFLIGYKMLPNVANSSVMVLCSRLLFSSKTCLKEIWRRLGKERGWEDPEDIRAVHGLQRRGEGCMDITPDWWKSSE